MAVMSCSSTMNSEQPLPAAFLKTVAAAPGVYLMRGQKDEVLYVGKAVNLRKRLASYARFAGHAHSKTTVLLARLHRIETIITRTEKEALILEASLIKQHRPKYNVILRDDKNYPLLKVTVQERWPRVLMTRRRQRDGARYFGPFASPGAMWETLRYLNELFPLRRCKSKDFAGQPRACLNFQMGRCLAPCVGKISHADYQLMVDNVLLVLEGKKEKLLQELAVQMDKAARGQRFEEAARCRDRIRAVRATLEKQLMVAEHRLDQDVFGFARQGNGVAVAVLLVRQGVMSGQRHYFFIEPVGDDASLLAEFLPRFYEGGRIMPQEILIPFAIEGMAALAEWLSEQQQRKVAILHPRRGDKLKLVAMAAANALQAFAEREIKKDSWEVLADALRQALKLDCQPQSIECLDISNLGGEQAVGALVRFDGGEKNTAGYRHFKIRTRSTPDDYAMMAEVLDRRLARGVKEGGLPNLLLLDGGKGQLNVARQALIHHGLTREVELAAIAKERREEGEKVFRPGRRNPLGLASHSPVLLFLMRIRDEAHRFGITMHKKLRHRQTLASRLDEVPGIGPAKKKALLRYFGSLRRIEAANPDELAVVKGIGPELARQVYGFLHPG